MTLHAPLSPLSLRFSRSFTFLRGVYPPAAVNPAAAAGLLPRVYCAVPRRGRAAAVPTVFQLPRRQQLRPPLLPRLTLELRRPSLRRLFTLPSLPATSRVNHAKVARSIPPTSEIATSYYSSAIILAIGRSVPVATRRRQRRCRSLSLAIPSPPLLSSFSAASTLTNLTIRPLLALSRCAVRCLSLLTLEFSGLLRPAYVW